MRYGKYLDTKIGRLYLEEEDSALVQLGSAGFERMEANQLDQEAGFLRIQDTLLLKQATVQVQEFLEGTRREFTLPIYMKGTDFQKKVWEALRGIPYGETRTYGQIAKEIGSPKGARAVGGACNRNPILLLIPCHRVIGGDGKLVGFGCGLPMKEALLELEGSLV